jgi:HEAT repeat protein
MTQPCSSPGRLGPSRPRTLRPMLVLPALAFAACAPPPAAVEALRLIDRGRYEEADRAAERGLTSEPGSEDLWRLRLRIAVLRRGPAEAAEVYRRRFYRFGHDRNLLRHLVVFVVRWGLNQRDPGVRLDAVQAARATDAPALEEDVGDRLQDPDELVRTWAAVAMSQTPAGADVLERQLASPRREAREVAVRELARLAGPAAISTLSGYIADRDPAMRSIAATALGTISKGAAEAVEPLLRLARDADARVRAEAIASLGALGHAKGREAIRNALGDAEPRVRLAAALVLAELKAPGAKEALGGIARGDDLSTALVAGARLARLGDAAPVLAVLERALGHGPWTVRAAALNTASGLGARALELARRGLKDQEPSVRMTAARAVAALGEKGAALATARALRSLACTAGSKLSGLCFESTELLAREGDPGARGELVRLVKDSPDAAVRLEALQVSLALSLAPQRLLALEALDDRDPGVLLAAAVWLYLHA